MEESRSSPLAVAWTPFTWAVIGFAIGTLAAAALIYSIDFSSNRLACVPPGAVIGGPIGALVGWFCWLQKHPPMPASSNRWFTFRLQTLFFLVCAVSLPLAWYASRPARQMREAKAELAIKQFGGRFDTGPVHDVAGQWAGLYMPSVSAAEFDEMCDALEEMPGTVALSIAFRIDNDRFERLTRIVHLESLGSHDTTITDAGLLHIRRMKRLQIFKMCVPSSVSVDAIEKLRKLSSLRLLGLYGNRFTSAERARLYQAFSDGSPPRIALQLYP